MAKRPSGFDFRDVSVALQKLRSFLLGRQHNLHGRFPPLISPRTLPTPDIPRGPEYKYANQYYDDRNALRSVKPPLVAPIGEGPPLCLDGKIKFGPVKADTVIQLSRTKAPAKNEKQNIK